MSHGEKPTKGRVKKTKEKASASSSKEPVTSNSKSFSEEELKELHTAFLLLDENRDGAVNAKELRCMLQNLGIHISEKLTHDLVQHASKSGSGLINEGEFLQWIAKIQSISKDKCSDDNLTEDLMAAFRVFDKDNNGFITKDELRSAMEMIGETFTDSDLNELLDVADIDHDGQINYEEFARLLT